jgi:hypothetical protein
MSIAIIADKIRAGRDGVREAGIYRDFTKRGLPSPFFHNGKSRFDMPVVRTEYDIDIRKLD